MTQETRYIPPTRSESNESKTYTPPALRLATAKFPWLSVIVALLYGVSPIDLLPDLIPIIGQLDDGILAIFTLALVGRWWFKKRAEGRISRVSR